MFRFPAVRLLGSIFFVLIPLAGVEIVERRVGLPSNIWMDICWTGASILAALSCLFSARCNSSEDRRKAWRLFAAGCACWAVGRSIIGCRELFLREIDPVGGLQDWFSFLMAPLFAWGFFHLRSTEEDALTAVRKLCNLGILTCAVIGIQLLVSTGRALAVRSPTPVVVFTALGWSALLPTVFAFGMVCLWLYRPSASRIAHGVLLGGIGCHAVGNVLYAGAVLQQTHRTGHSLCDYLWLLGFSWICWAAWEERGASEQQPAPRSSAAPRRDFRAGLEAALPAVAMLAVVALGAAMPGYSDSRVAEYLIPVMGVLICLVGLREVWTRRLDEALFLRLKASEARFRQVMECNMAGLFFRDLHGKITEANDAFLETVGYSRADLKAGRVNWVSMTPPESVSLDERAWDEMRRVGACEPYEKELFHKTGARVPLLIGGALSANDSHVCVGFAVDVSARRAVERALHESQNRYRALAENSSMGVWQIDFSGGTVFANPRMLEMLQLENLEELGSSTYHRFFSPQSLEAIEREHRKRAAGLSSSYEADLVGKKGRRLPVLISGAPVPGADNALQSLIATFTDCTELHEAQYALRQSEERFRALVENSNDAISVWDASGRVLFTTGSNQRILGYSAAQSVGKFGPDFIHPDDRSMILEALQSAVSEPGRKVAMQVRARHADGSLRWCEGVFTNLLHDPAINGIILNYHDITERHETQKALRASEARLHAFLENSPAIMFIKDAAGRYELVNPAFESILGRPVSDLLGKTELECFPIEQTGGAMAADHQVLSTGRPVQVDVTLVSKSGPRFAFVHKFPLRDDEGANTGVGGIVTDITERHRVEEALRRSEERYRMLVENARDAIFTLSPDGLLTSLNPAAETITGFRIAEWLNRSFMPLVLPEDRERAMELFRAALSGVKLPPFELRLQTSARGSVVLEFTLTHQMEEGKVAALVGIGRNITQRRQLEEQLRQAQKMESIGQLAGGVAHDFNNLLTVVQGNASLMLLDESLDKEVLEMAREISDAADRAAGLTRQLLAFSRRQLIQARDLDLNEVIASIGKMLRRLLGEDVTLQVDSGSNLPMVHADPGMMEQVILNLAINARDAMPQGGRLTIGATHLEISEEIRSRNPEAHPGQFVRVSVADSGTGIAPEHLSRIFEPFFTTKDVGKGTGLGLATVYGIVRQHRGWIEVKSDLGKGTDFAVYLPVSQKTSGNVGQLREAGLPGGSETILLVEDETPVREIVRTVLRRLGYTVIEAASGSEALQIWEDHSQEIDLLFTDIVLPDGVSGPQLSDLLRASAPHLKVLFTSGYSTTLVMKEGRHRSGVTHLQKPYHPQQLAEALRAVFDRKEESGASEGISA